MQRPMQEISYKAPIDNIVRRESVPTDWPYDAVAEVLAFRAGMQPGDVFELIPGDDGIFTLLATGTSV